MKIGDKPTFVDRPEPKPVERPEVMKAAKQFESLFVNQLVTAMRKTVVKSGFVPESNAEKIYQSMLDQRHSEQIAETGQLGLSKMIYDHLLRSSRSR